MLNLLVILTLNTTPNLEKFINLNLFYLEQKGIICYAQTLNEIYGCFALYKPYKPKHIWYVFLGHSNGKKLTNSLYLKDLKFPQKIDYIILDGCYLGKNKSLIKQLAYKYTKYGVFASSNKIPALGLIPLYRDKWNNPYEELKKIKKFYKNNPLGKYIYFQPSF
jgi:hypothetical protein